MKHSLKWFENRIGKVIYRKKGTCSCSTCEEVVKNGLTIRDKDHADYVFNIQHDLDIDYKD